MIYSKIISTGNYLPKNIITNNKLSKIINTSNDWIQKRTGISQRHIVNKKYETVYTMGLNAAKDAIKNAQIKKTSIDMIIATTTSADFIFPATACVIQKMLKINECPAFDVQAACGGFLYAINIANSYIKTGIFKRILIVGSEVMSKKIDWTNKSICVLFGDGAGAIILEASKKPGIISTKINANGYYDKLLYLKNSHPLSFIEMNGKKIFKLAIKYSIKNYLQIFKINNLNINNIDWVIPHQANIRIIKLLAKKLKISIKKFIITIDKFANTSSASIPITLHYAIENKILKTNQHILINSFGGGLTWGSAIIKY